MNYSLGGFRRSICSRRRLLLAVALAANLAVIAADSPDEAKAIREIEQLGGTVTRDGKTPGRPCDGCRLQGESTDSNKKHLNLLKAAQGT